MATVLAFPLARRGRFIRKQASWLAGMSDRGLERTLWSQLQLQRDALLNKGVDPRTVDVEVGALERAIRAELCAWGRRA